MRYARKSVEASIASVADAMGISADTLRAYEADRATVTAGITRRHAHALELVSRRQR